jgi:hypothetical protein
MLFRKLKSLRSLTLLASLGALLTMPSLAKAGDILPFFTDGLWDSPNWQQHVVQGIGDVVRTGVTAAADYFTDGDPVAQAAGYTAGSVLRNVFYMVGGTLHNNGQAPPPPPAPALRPIPPGNYALAFYYLWNSQSHFFAQTHMFAPNNPARWVFIMPGAPKTSYTEIERTPQQVILRRDADGHTVRITPDGVLTVWNGHTFVPYVHGVLVTIHLNQ